MNRFVYFFAALVACFALMGPAAAAVNINSATVEELQALKGVGPKKAQDIVDYRKKNGPFKKIDDLSKVKGIGPGIIKQIKADVSVDGAPAAKEEQKSGKPADAKPKTEPTKK